MNDVKILSLNPENQFLGKEELPSFKLTYFFKKICCLQQIDFFWFDNIIY